MSFTVHCGDALTVLRTMPDESVHCCITSPPYWSLRDYGTAQWEGGDAECDHKETALVGKASTLRSDGREHSGPYEGEKAATFSVTPFRKECGKCGAKRIDQQMGLERTPEEYVSRMVEVFREVRRVLRVDGTLWCNIGDSYCSGTGKDRLPTTTAGPRVPAGWSNRSQPQRTRPVGDIKPKDLVGIPWMLAFALRADGWYLRSEIIWAKPNPMPESVTDRPTKAHEQIFLLTKSAKYFYDADAIREKATGHTPGIDDWSTRKANGEPTRHGLAGAAAVKAGNFKAHPLQGSHGTTGHDGNGMRMPEKYLNPNGRNKRTVWTVATQPTPEAHFATYPIALVEPCVLAGSLAGGVILDPFCGAGTTGMAALKHGRDFIGIELSAEYVEITRERLAGKMPLLAQEFIAERAV